MTQEGTNQEVGKKAPAFEGGRLPGTHTFPFLGDPVYFQCPGTELPLGEVWGFTQMKLGPGLGGFAWLQGDKKQWQYDNAGDEKYFKPHGALLSK